MHLHQKTIDALNELSRINPSILIKPGNVLTTINGHKTHLSSIEVPDHFPQEFGIYDVAQFVKMVKMMSGRHIWRRANKGIIKKLSFGFEKEVVADGDDCWFVVISSPEMVVRYQGADQSMMVTPPKKPLQLPSIDYWFTLTRNELDNITKLGKVAGAPLVRFVDSGDVLVAHIEHFYKHHHRIVSVPLRSSDSGFRENGFEVPFNLTDTIDKLPIAPFYRFEGSVKGICKVTGMDSDEETHLLTSWIADCNPRESRLKEVA